MPLSACLLAFSGVVGLWGIGFFSFDLNRSIFRKTYEAEARQEGEAEKDQQFLRLAMAHPQDFLALRENKNFKQPLPNQILAPKPGDKDPELLYSTFLTLLSDEKPASAEDVLAALDKSVPPQTAEERARRKAYLDGGGSLADVSELLPSAQRIVKRANYINGRLGFWAGLTSIMLNFGAVLGIYAFTVITHYTGRKPAFAVSFVLAMISTAMVFWYLTQFSQIFWMIPLMGFCQLSLFGGYAIYFPELFPTHLRSTGTSFCYNVGRFVAASGPFALGLLTKVVFSEAMDTWKACATRAWPCAPCS